MLWDWYKGSCLGTETPYVYQSVQSVPPPKGYHAVYINHLGRHGSRYVTGPEAVERLDKVLEDVAQNNQLTKMGMGLSLQVEKFLALSNRKYGLLTPLGRSEQKGIARRMYKKYPRVFGREVRAVSTYVTRTKQSMDVFMEELGRYTSPKAFVISSNGKVDPLLRFFDLNEAYKAYKEKGIWKEELRQFEARKDVSTPLLSPFFKKDYPISQIGALALGTTLYKMYANTFNMQVDLGLGKYFSKEALQYYWENENLRNFLEKGPSNVGEDLPTNIAFALLRDFLETSEEALNTGKVSANLRFAHAETLIPFASLLKLACCSKQTNDLNLVADIWQDSCIARMAGNIQWIFYKSEASKPILVKLLYNEVTMPFPMPSGYGPYYRWDDVKTFYWQILNSLDIPKVESVVEQVKYYQTM